MVEGVIVQQLKQIEDERGKVMHMLRADSPFFMGFGEIYFSIINPGAVKAWKRHLKVTQHLAVPVGKIRLVIFDYRKDSPSCGTIDVLETGEDNYCLVKIPPLIWYGFKGMSLGKTLIANCTDMPHDPDEVERLSPSDRQIPYNWGND